MTKKRKAKQGGELRLSNLPRNWLHQALTYLDKGELISRVVVEILEIALLYFLFIRFAIKFPIDSIYVFLLSGIIVHTLNWIFNANFWTVILFSFPELTNPGEIITCDYLNHMSLRLSKHSSVTVLAIYGSISRRQWHERSDVDIRILRKPGIGNLISAFFITMRERAIAFIKRQPIDLYLADDVNFLLKMRNDESPIFLIRRDNRLKNYFPENQPIVLKTLR